MTTESEKLQNDLEPINSWEYKNYLMKHKLLQIEKTLKIIETRVPHGLREIEGINKALDNIKELITKN